MPQTKKKDKRILMKKVSFDENLMQILENFTVYRKISVLVSNNSKF